MPKNSTLKRNKIAEALQKVRIRNKTECTGFSEIKTRILLNTNENEKKKCIIVIESIFS